MHTSQSEIQLDSGDEDKKNAEKTGLLDKIKFFYMFWRPVLLQPPSG